MTTLEELEAAVRRLPGAEPAAFRAWFAEFDAKAWDRQSESGLLAGRLDALADEAREDLPEGRR